MAHVLHGYVCAESLLGGMDWARLGSNDVPDDPRDLGLQA